jgi:AAA domain-containing protein/primase/DNA polymerase family protein
MTTANMLPAVPQILQGMPNWVAWKLVERNGETTKPPFIAGTDFKKFASSTDSSTWTDFATAVASTDLNHVQGIGFVLGGRAIEAGVIGLDIDGCRNPETGEITEWADEIIQQLDSYSEVTPSGTGVRVWVIGKVLGQEKVFKLDPSIGHGDKVQIEIYDRARYFTITGDSVFEEPGNIESRDLTLVYQIIRDLKTKHPASSKPTAEATITSAVPIAPAKEYESVQVQKTGTAITDKLELLMHGAITSTKPFILSDTGGSVQYPSHSEADMALCSLLALKYGDNPDAIWNDFQDSALFRPKWEKREGDFRRDTIAKAIKWAKEENARRIAADQTKTKTNPLPAAVATREEDLLVSVDGDQFMAEDIPPRRVLLRTITNKEPVFFQQSINQIFAWRGIGKTNVGLGLTMAFATAGSFLNWEVPEKCRVLYVEGEMPQSQLQQRWNAIVGKTNGYARLVTIDKQPRNMMSKLSTQIGRDKIETHLAKEETEGRKVDIIMLDSISTLFNIAANDEDVWLNIQDWLISLRSKGLTIFFFHHSGKLGASRSHSKSEDMLDVSIKLEAPKERESGCLHAILSYDKARAGLDEPAAEIKMKRVHSDACACRKGAGLILGCPGDSVAWEYKPSADANRMKASVMFEEEASLGDVAKALGVPRATVQSWKKKWDENRIVVDLNSRS